jgi:serine/threonine protein kinase KIN1/2
VATTSTKSPTVIRNDLVKIFEMLGVRYRPIQGGFECAHAPSIDLSSVGSQRPDQNANEAAPSTPLRALSSVRRRSSRIMGGRSPLSRGGEREARDASISQSSIARDGASMVGDPTSSSSFAVVGHASPFDEPASPMAISATPGGSGGRDTTTATTLDYPATKMSNSLIVRFEVYIVKVNNGPPPFFFLSLCLCNDCF